MVGNVNGLVDTGNSAVSQAASGQKKTKSSSDLPTALSQFEGMLQLWFSGQGTNATQQESAPKKQGLIAMTSESMVAKPGAGGTKAESMAAKPGAGGTKAESMVAKPGPGGTKPSTLVQGFTGGKGQPSLLSEVQGSISKTGTSVSAGSAGGAADFALLSSEVPKNQKSSPSSMPGITMLKDKLQQSSKTKTSTQATVGVGAGAATNLQASAVVTNSPVADVTSQGHPRTASTQPTAQLGQQTSSLDKVAGWNMLSNKAAQGTSIPQTASHSGKVSGTPSNFTNAGLNTSGLFALQMSNLNGNVPAASPVAGNQQPTLNLAQGQAAAQQQLGSWIIQQANAGPQQVQVQVVPQGMGSIVISVTHDANGVNVQLEASAMQTVQWLQQTAPQVMDAVRSSGLNVTGLDVSFGQANLSHDNSGRQNARREPPVNRLKATGVSSFGSAPRDGALEQAWDLLSHRISVRV